MININIATCRKCGHPLWVHKTMGERKKPFCPLCGEMSVNIQGLENVTLNTAACGLCGHPLWTYKRKGEAKKFYCPHCGSSAVNVVWKSGITHHDKRMRRW